jgi:hypothetical protein
MALAAPFVGLGRGHVHWRYKAMPLLSEEAPREAIAYKL